MLTPSAIPLLFRDRTAFSAVLPGQRIVSSVPRSSPLPSPDLGAVFRVPRI